MQIFSKKPLKNLDDVKAAKLFTSKGDDRTVQFYASNGFHPVALLPSDIPAQLKLSTGLIDTAPYPPYMALTLQIFRDAKYMLDIHAAPFIGATIESNDAWGKISADDQAKVIAAAKAMEQRIRTDAPKQDADSIAAMTARGLQVIAGADSRDSTCLKAPVPDYRAALQQPVKGLKVGIVRECFAAEGLDPQVKASVMAAAEQLQALGCELVDVSCPRFNDGIATYYVIAPSEASANLARYDGVKYGHRASQVDTLAELYCRTRDEGFGAEVKRRIMLGTYVLSAGYYDAFYLKAQQVRTLLRQDYERAFERADVIAMPTMGPSTLWLTSRAAVSNWDFIF